ncbi:hypothetical protein INR49_017762 [Caranx melampygus]|nr:hypothetical protein INR49_017762 [Caranx melampygus]
MNTGLNIHFMVVLHNFLDRIDSVRQSDYTPTDQSLKCHKSVSRNSSLSSRKTPKPNLVGGWKLMRKRASVLPESTPQETDATGKSL